MNGIFYKIIDVIFPKQCVNCMKSGNYLCNFCKKKFIHFEVEKICHVCRNEVWTNLHTHKFCSKKSEIDFVLFSVRYSKLVEKIISELKYSYNFDICSLIVRLIIEVIDIQMLCNSVLVPIPLHKGKFNLRGFNQADLIARGLSEEIKKLKIKSEVQNLLIRNKKTKTQVGMSQQERHLNLDNAFEINQKFTERIKSIKKQNKRIILVDDVYTTGTTLEKCTNVLKENGINRVGGLVFARA